jgi:phosphomannomutase
LAKVSLKPVLAAETGMAIAAFSNAKRVPAARDTRSSGTMLQEALVSGLLSSEANTKDLGTLPTPTPTFLTGTEPMMRLTAEGESLKTAKKIMKKGGMILSNALEK